MFLIGGYIMRRRRVRNTKRHRRFLSHTAHRMRAGNLVKRFSRGGYRF